MKHFLLWALFGLLMTACKNDPTPPKDTKMPAIYDEVMAVHDDVMPRMSDIMSLKQQLRKHLTKEDKKEQILEQIQVLDHADRAMMDWMGELQVPKTEPQRTEYLKIQLQEIINVRDEMLHSIQSGNALLNELNAEK